MLEYFDYCDKSELALRADTFLNEERKIAETCGCLSFIGCASDTLRTLHRLLIAVIDPNHPFWEYSQRKFVEFWNGKIDDADMAEKISSDAKYRISFQKVADALSELLQGWAFQQGVIRCPSIGSRAALRMLEYFDYCDELEPTLRADAFLSEERKLAETSGYLSFVGCASDTLSILHRILIAVIDPNHPFWEYSQRKFVEWREGEIDDASMADKISNDAKCRIGFQTVADAIGGRLRSSAGG